MLAALTMVGTPAVAAHADETDCAGSRYVEGGYEAFEIETRFLPPALRDRSFDCAARIADRPIDGGLNADGEYDPWVEYLLLYVDTGFADFVALMREFERSGYSPGGDIYVADGSGAGLDIDQLAALDPAPASAFARFSNPQDDPQNVAPGSNIYSFEWADGVADAPAGIDGRPQLLAEIQLNAPFVDGTGIDDPSVLSGLPTIYLPSGVQWTFIGAGSLMLMLVVGWPSTLLNSIVGSRYQSLVRWVTTRVRRRPVDAAEPADPTHPAAIRRSRLPGWLMWPGFALAAILGAFVDPDFGVNLMSLRLVITLFLSFVLFNLLSWAIVRRVAVRLQPDSDPYLRFRWGSLVLVLLAVLVARLLGLEPGVIFGLVAGIAYATSLQAAKSAVVTIVGSALGLAFALVAWVGYSLLAPIEVDNVAYGFLVEFLAGVTFKGVSTLPLSLLPLGTLDGAKVFGWKRLAWGSSYAVGLAAFMIVLLTVPKAWGEIPGDFVKWLVLFGVYALVAIVLWAVNARMLKAKPLPPEAQQGDQPDAITID